MKLFIYALNNTLYEGEAELVGLPTVDGEISVLDNHLPIITTLKKGEVKIKNGKEIRSFQIKSGFAEINQKQVVILAK